MYDVDFNGMAFSKNLHKDGCIMELYYAPKCNILFFALEIQGCIIYSRNRVVNYLVMDFGYCVN